MNPQGTGELENLAYFLIDIKEQQRNHRHYDTMIFFLWLNIQLCKGGRLCSFSSK